MKYVSSSNIFSWYVRITLVPTNMVLEAMDLSVTLTLAEVIVTECKKIFFLNPRQRSPDIPARDPGISSFLYSDIVQ